MASPTVDEQFHAFHALIADRGKVNHRHPADFPTAVQLFLQIHARGQAVTGDEVRNWFGEAGWAEADAHEMGTISDVVWHVLRSRGRR